MSEPFPRPTPDQDPRYLRARKIWLDDVGLARAEKRMWQRATFAVSAIAALAVLGVIVQSLKSRVEPYLIEVDARGEVRQVGVVTTQKWELDESVMRAELERWLRNLRSVSSDQDIFTQRMAYIHTHASDAAILLLEQHQEARDPYDMFGRQTRTVHVEAMTRVPGSQSSWRVQWHESIRGIKGEDLGSEEYIGEFQLVVRPPRTASAIHDNPLGVFISFFSIDPRSQTP